MTRTVSSWLSGPESADPGRRTGHPGESLGLPARGSGSLAGPGRRLVALAADWLIAVGLAGLAVTLGLVKLEEYLFSGDWQRATLVIWLLLGALSVRLFGFTPGQFACGLQVAPVGTAEQPIPAGAGVGIGRALARGVLVALVIPALFTDADRRGLQDRLTRTAVVRR